MAELQVIARIRNAFEGKFGIPRQSGLVENVVSEVVFEPEFRTDEALRGIADYSHLWLIWGFHEAERDGWKPTVRPPRLGGNKRMGVFATRSPFRPNALGLSCVTLLGVEKGREGSVLKVGGADLMNGTPIYDIKPYLPYADCRPEATGGFTDETEKRRLTVELPARLRGRMPPETERELTALLREDPRPAYQDDPLREYRFEFGGFHVSFRVNGNQATVTGLERI